MDLGFGCCRDSPQRAPARRPVCADVPVLMGQQHAHVIINVLVIVTEDEGL